MKFGVVRFPGSCDEVDASIAAARAGESQILWHRDKRLPDVDAVIVPGGFSYGDYLRAGAIAQFSPIMTAIIDFARAGGPVLGICNGFQILCESGLLPGALLRNENLKFTCRQVNLVVESDRTAWTHSFEKGSTISIPAKHASGRYFVDDETLQHLNDHDQIVFRYHRDHNFNGSTADIAGVTNEAGNVVGLMPHPEHAVDPRSGSTDGLALFESVALVNA